jgi:hypothetical protein
MSKLKENEMGDRMMTGLPYSQGGGLGTPTLDTISSPDISQNPEKFKYPQTAASASDITVPPPEDYDNSPAKSRQDYEKSVDSIKYKVTPDEIIAGMQYCLKKMVFKRKDTAKQIVVACLKKDPKYFSKLKMLNIDDNAINEIILENEMYYTSQEKEIAKIMRKMYLDKIIKKRY